MNDDHASLDRALAALDLAPAAGQAWRTGWAATQSGFDPDRPFFLSADLVADIGRKLGLGAELHAALARSAGMFTDRPILRRLAWQCHCQMQNWPEDGSPGPGAWPAIPRALGEPWTLFYALVLLAGAPLLYARHARRGIPEAVTTDTLSDLEIWILEYRRRHGHLGLEELGWLSHHFRGNLCRLGRLQFNLEHWGYDFHVFRRRAGGAAAILAGDRLGFRADGQFSDADGLKNAPPAWVATLDWSRPGRVRGHPVDTVAGRAGSVPVELDLADWIPVFKKGDAALGVHIPAAGPMTPEACRDSFRRAAAFFPVHFPEFPWRAFTCNSWLLDPQLAQYLPADANIVQFQRAMLLFPVPGADAAQHYERVFGARFRDLPPERIHEAPQVTSLQRALAQHVRAGGRWRMGGGMAFPETPGRVAECSDVPGSRRTGSRATTRRGAR